MLLTRLRTRPCMARFCRSSSGRSTSRLPSSWRTVILPGISLSRVPFGHLTVMCPAAMVTSTPLGTGIGDLPIRLIEASPHVTEDLAAHALAASLSIGHEALARRQHRDAEPAQNAGDTVGL